MIQIVYSTFLGWQTQLWDARRPAHTLGNLRAGRGVKAPLLPTVGDSHVIGGASIQTFWFQKGPPRARIFRMPQLVVSMENLGGREES